ncbi:MAG: hypothetical protein QM808_00485 [Steroidobacteraceae bacterium]
MSNYAADLIDAPVIARDDSSGRAAWDERGNSVWEWQTEPGVYSRNADTQRVRALQLADLELLDAAVPGNERVFAATQERSHSLRAGVNVQARGNSQSNQKLQQTGLLGRLMGR